MSDTPTPHLEAAPGDYAPTVLLPGDPRRAQFIAEHYFDDARQVNGVRGALGFTGTHDGLPVSVQSVGMGVPSAAIYYTELLRFYGCTTLIRVGSCGSLSERVGLGDIIAATSAGTDSAAVRSITGGLDIPATADFALLRASVETAESLDVSVAVGTVFTSDLFYGAGDDQFPVLTAHGVLGVEMEIAVLYALATAHGASALGLVTVSDDIVRGERMSAADRENTFHDMMRVALGAAKRANGG